MRLDRCLAHTIREARPTLPALPRRVSATLPHDPDQESSPGRLNLRKVYFLESCAPRRRHGPATSLYLYIVGPPRCALPSRFPKRQAREGRYLIHPRYLASLIRPKLRGSRLPLPRCRARLAGAFVPGDAPPPSFAVLSLGAWDRYRTPRTGRLVRVLLSFPPAPPGKETTAS